MGKSAKFLCVGGVLCAVYSSSAFAVREAHLSNKHAGAFTQYVIRPDLNAASSYKLKSGSELSVQADALSGAARIITGDFQLAVPMDGNKTDRALALEHASLNFIIDHPGLFGEMTAADLKLDDAALLVTDSEQFLKFRVSRDGAAISDAMIDMRFKKGKLAQINNRSFSEAKVRFSMQKHDTRANLDKNVLFNSTQYQNTVLRVVSTKAGYELQPVDAYLSSMGEDQYQVQVSQATGDILEATSVVTHATVQAEYYNRTYRDDAIVVGPLADLEVSTQAETTVATDASGNFEVQPEFTAFVEGLRNSRFDVKTKTGDLVKASAETVDGVTQINFKRQADVAAEADAQVAQVMLFKHLSKMSDYAQRFIDTEWLHSQLTVNANEDQHCNAYWHKIRKDINFFTAGTAYGYTCANSALVADVVYHEWGHGLDQMTGDIEDGAYSEGFGDIMSLLHTRSPVLGPNFFTDGKPVRDMEPDRIYPRDRDAFSVHNEGQIIGSTFYDLFQSLTAKYGEDKAAEMLANYAFKMIFTASFYTDVYNALLVIDDNDANVDNGTPNICLLNEVFMKHGLATKTPQCLLGSVNNLQLREIIGNSNGVIEPGESLELRPILFNNTTRALDGVKGTLNVTGNEGISLSTTELFWPNVDIQNSVETTSTTTLSVGSDVACGTRFDLQVRLDLENSSDSITHSLLVGKVIGTESIYNTTSEFPLEIPDDSSVSFELNVDGDQWADDTKVLKTHLNFDITHPYIGDISVDLISPDGKMFRVYQGRGDVDDVTFDKDVSSIVGSVKGKGTWKVKVSDNANSDEGAINSFSMKLTPELYQCD